MTCADIVKGLPINAPAIVEIIGARSANAVNNAWFRHPSNRRHTRRPKRTITVARLLELSDQDLLLTRNFGQKALGHVHRLRQIVAGFSA